MSRKGQKLNPMHHFDGFISQDDDPERDLALLLDQLQPGDLRLLEPVISLYGAELYRFVYALLDRQTRSASPQMVMQVLTDVLVSAITASSGFRGELSVREWLFKLTIRNWRWRQRRDAWRRRLSGRREPSHPAPRPDPGSDMKGRAWAVMETFDDQACLAALLHYGWGFDAPAIARMTGFSRSKVLRKLDAVRGAVRADLLAAGYKWAHAQLAHYPYQVLIIARLNGNGGLPVGEEQLLRDHLETCANCRDYSVDLERLEYYLREWWQERYARIALPDGILAELSEAVRKKLEKPEIRLRRPQVGSRVVQLVLLVLLVAGVDWAFRMMAGSGEKAAELSGPTAVPATKASQPSAGTSGEGETDTGYAAALFVHRFDFNVDPVISSDGRWLAYAWRLDLPRGDGIENTRERLSSGIVLTDLNERRTTQIALEETASRSYLIGREEGAVNTNVLGSIDGQIASPSISADGRWLVFAVIQPVDRMSWRMRPCPSPENGCGIIMLYDREAGTFKKVSLGQYGSFPNGSVLQPEISADGGTIIYWSSASNLLDVDDEYCSSAGEPPYNCWDLFVYDRVNESTERIPIGRRYEQLIWNDPVSLSADGNYVALTIHHRDRFAEQLDLNEGEANVYWIDRKNEYVQLVNSRTDGVPGDELSVLPVVSADGRYVAFATRAGNLDELDRNDHFDVYLKDTQTGEVEWISHAPWYVDSNDSSGLISISDLVSGRYSRLGLTGDAHSVLYLSIATNLSNRGSAWCAAHGTSFGRCANIYYHDRYTGAIGPVLEAPETPGAYINPFISPEGRYVIAVYQYEVCPAPYGCAEIWVYDRQAGDVKAKLPVPELGKAGGNDGH